MEEVITQEELEFVQDYLDPLRKPEVLWSDFYNDVFWDERVYQIDMLLDDNDRIVCSSARGVGKTETIKSKLTNIVLNPRNAGQEVLVAAPNKVHLTALWSKLAMVFQRDVFINDLLTKLTSSENYTMIFSTGVIVHGRITSSSSGTSLYGLHVDYAFIEEGALFGSAETEELQGCLNHGSKIFIIGVPNGILSSYLFKAFNDDEYQKYNITKFEDPTFTEEEHQRLIKLFGGKETQAYKNQVLGQTGQPSHLTFPIKFWQKCLFDYPNYQFLGLTEKDIDMGIDTLNLPRPEKATEYIDIGIDTGYSPDPTVILFFTDDNTLFFRIQLEEVAYHKQAKLFHQLATYYNARRISMDRGNAGRAVYQMIIDEKEYPKRCYDIIPVDFGGTVVTGVDEQYNEIKERIKMFSTVLLRKAFENNFIHMPEQAFGVVNEIQNSTCSITPSGNMVFHGIDHNLDAMRAHVIADYIQETEQIDKEFDFAMIDF